MTTTTIEKTSLNDPLDSYLRDVVQTLDAAVRQGLRNAQDQPAVTARNISDCEEILGVIMQGDVQEWVGASQP